MTVVMIVDDSLTVRMDLVDALDGAGLRSVPCATLAEARDALRGHAIALAILDVRLPDGDGIEFLEELRADPRHAELPVLMLSSEAEVKDRIRGLRRGANDYLGKPYDTAAMIDRVRQLVGGVVAQDRLVIVIDDSPTFRAVLCEVLTDAGYTTMTAASGPEGLRLAALQRPAAIIVDGVLPDMDGASVIRRVRLDPALRTIPCILLTGSDEAVAEVHALSAGADAFVRKESDIELILARLAAVLRAARGEPARPVSLAVPRRILAVDDSATYLHALADQLRDEGYDVAQATSGEEALELLAVQHVDCILLDRVMPGLSGAETCERIKAAPVVRDIPLIMLTSLEGGDAMIEGFSAGADDFIFKSSGVDVLKARVQAQIRRKLFEDEHRSTREQLLRSEHEAAEAQVARELAKTRAALVEQLELSNHELAAANRELAAANRELEAFSYSVSHDLRAPLRSIGAFTRALAEDASDRLGPADRGHIDRVLAATAQMSDLIDALLELSRISRAPLSRTRVDLSAIAGDVLGALGQREPGRDVAATVAPGLVASADGKLVRIVLDNLLGNAWKFTSRRSHARIELGAMSDQGDRIFFVRDDGAGFDPASATQLFAPFQRLHSEAEFRGTGIGLATVHRIIERHGGRIWAEGMVESGATFYFTLPAAT
ncbi:MAG TPA: response regulator [Kofleriaceae bacterium]|jgi:DNA-binding response OmpR family regulator